MKKVVRHQRLFKSNVRYFCLETNIASIRIFLRQNLISIDKEIHLSIYKFIEK